MLWNIDGSPYARSRYLQTTRDGTAAVTPLEQIYANGAAARTGVSYLSPPATRLSLLRRVTSSATADRLSGLSFRKDVSIGTALKLLNAAPRYFSLK